MGLRVACRMTEEMLRSNMSVLNVPTTTFIAGDVLYVSIETVVVGIVSEENEMMGTNSSV